MGLGDGPFPSGTCSEAPLGGRWSDRLLRGSSRAVAKFGRHRLPPMSEEQEEVIESEGGSFWTVFWRRRSSERSEGLLVWSPGWVPSGTLVLVMPGRGTLARRNGRAGPDGVVDDDERERAFRRATTRVPGKARLAHAATVGPVGVGVAPGEPGGGAIARGPRPDGR